MTRSGRKRAIDRERLGRVLRGLDLVLLRAQADREQAQQARVVVDDQDARGAAGGAGHGGIVAGRKFAKRVRFRG